MLPHGMKFVLSGIHRRESVSIALGHDSRCARARSPGTSKWNKVEHRLFSFISINWRGKPLRTYRTIVQLIAATTTDAGLTVRAELDRNKYPKGVKVSDAQLSAVNLTRHTFHGDWNYTIKPQSRRTK